MTTTTKRSESERDRLMSGGELSREPQGTPASGAERESRERDDDGVSVRKSVLRRCQSRDGMSFERDWIEEIVWSV